MSACKGSAASVLVALTRKGGILVSWANACRATAAVSCTHLQVQTERHALADTRTQRVINKGCHDCLVLPWFRSPGPVLPVADCPAVSGWPPHRPVRAGVHARARATVGPHRPHSHQMQTLPGGQIAQTVALLPATLLAHFCFPSVLSPCSVRLSLVMW